MIYDRFTDFFPVSSLSQRCANSLEEVDINIIKTIETTNLNLDTKIYIPALGRSIAFALR